MVVVKQEVGGPSPQVPQERDISIRDRGIGKSGTECICGVGDVREGDGKRVDEGEYRTVVKQLSIDVTNISAYLLIETGPRGTDRLRKEEGAESGWFSMRELERNRQKCG